MSLNNRSGSDTLLNSTTEGQIQVSHLVVMIVTALKPYIANVSFAVLLQSNLVGGHNLSP